ncbi:MAG TPA: alkaline shock response membrane anchor protein AmaP [Desulfitobacterium dehalogenans]|uniref:Alkaline shock response membrane anchor protein AmaP n=1 Tax=Desulfitobacterium dehalogenans TaxID=36854 RepID=A0A7C6Z2I8_9FIRM|nr:alkaline shock response membrane anchor protein AmaP [Desulfitobacterium dehalogenans]
MIGYSVGALLVVIGGYILAIGTGWRLPYELILDGLNWLRANTWESLIIAIFIIVLGILPFIKPRKSIDHTFRTVSQLGEVRVTVDAIGDLIVRSAQSKNGVRLVKPLIKQREDGLEILLDCQFNPETVITEVSEQLQTQIKEDIERFTGIKVAEVKVLVRRLDPVQPNRSPRVR